MNLAYLTDIIILLMAAVITVPLFRLAGLGTVPGFLVAGVMVGPSDDRQFNERANMRAAEVLPTPRVPQNRCP